MKHLHKLVYILLKNGYTEEAKELTKVEQVWELDKSNPPIKGSPPFRILRQGFDWGSTDQGIGYWDRVDGILEKIG